MIRQENCDVLIIGSGAAGLTAALRLPTHMRIALVSKKQMEAGSSFYAQGGIAAVLGKQDSFDAHIDDTLKSGAGLCRRPIVEQVVRQAPAVVRWLLKQGMPFTADQEDGFHLGQEGGHSHRRVLHARDETGRALHKTLLQRIQELPHIQSFEQYLAIDLIVGTHPATGRRHCLGAYLFDRCHGRVVTMRAPNTVLATGGASKAYLYSSNPDVSTGDGIAIGWRAGCRVANMEFIQFHPTCLYHPQNRSFLISETLRGEGAILRLPNGEPFMASFDKRAELAPRDIVARAIDYEMKKRGLNHVCLDISHRPRDFILRSFPNIYRQCRRFGIDPCRQSIPVVPAAHYSCGGLLVDHHGCTDLPGLYAIGETACTGLHGANRMASNSLLECLVFADAAARHISQHSSRAILSSLAPLPEWDDSRVRDSEEEVIILHSWEELRRLMWNYVGIVRSKQRLRCATARLRLLRSEIQDYYSRFRVTDNLLELRNLILVSELIVRSAMQRRESRGLHYTLDYPHCQKHARESILVPDGSPFSEQDIPFPLRLLHHNR